MNEDIKKQDWEVLEYFLTEKIDSMVKRFNLLYNSNIIDEDIIKNKLVIKFGKICNKLYNKNKNYNYLDLRNYTRLSVLRLIIDEYENQQKMQAKYKKYKAEKIRESKLKKSNNRTIKDINLNKLSPQQKKIVELKLLGLTNKQISVKMKITENSIRQQFYRIRKLFKMINKRKRVIQKQFELYVNECFWCVKDIEMFNYYKPEIIELEVSKNYKDDDNNIIYGTKYNEDPCTLYMTGIDNDNIDAYSRTGTETLQFKLTQIIGHRSIWNYNNKDIIVGENGLEWIQINKG